MNIQLGYAHVLALLLVGVAFVFVNILVGRLVQPRKLSRGKALAYECGEIPVGTGWIGFNIRFYIFALIFLIFDVEMAVTFPVGVIFRQWQADGRGWLVFTELAVFLGILFVGLIYLWRCGDLNWLKSIAPGEGPAKARKAFERKFFDDKGYGPTT
ncbi:MAG: NADH-quinone oxidoreductase subunit A [Nitrospirae bacterium]|nr:NADH-quinone oxidoreductase subunit A [Nitrospirota bacterium]